MKTRHECEGESELEGRYEPAEILIRGSADGYRRFAEELDKRTSFTCKLMVESEQVSGYPFVLKSICVTVSDGPIVLRPLKNCLSITGGAASLEKLAATLRFFASQLDEIADQRHHLHVEHAPNGYIDPSAVPLILSPK